MFHWPVPDAPTAGSGPVHGHRWVCGLARWAVQWASNGPLRRISCKRTTALGFDRERGDSFLRLAARGFSPTYVLGGRRGPTPVYPAKSVRLLAPGRSLVSSSRSVPLTDWSHRAARSVLVESGPVECGWPVRTAVPKAWAGRNREETPFAWSGIWHIASCRSVPAAGGSACGSPLVAWL